MRQSILKAFGLSESETLNYDLGGQQFDDSTSSDKETALTSNTIQNINAAVNEDDKSPKIRQEDTLDDSFLTTVSSTNVRAPTNTFRERALLSKTPEDVYLNTTDERQKMNMMLSAQDVALHAGENIHLRDSFVFEWNGHLGNSCAWHQGCLMLTNYRIIFKPSNISTYDDIPIFQGSQIPLATIHRVDKIGGKSNKQDHSYLIEIFTKDLRHVKFSFLPTAGTRGRIFRFIKEEKFEFFCFQYKLPVTENMINGWKIFDIKREFTRQGALPNPSQQNQAHSTWRLCTVNSDYKMCDTYSAQFMVPSDISDEEIRAVAAFRSKGRLPILSWYCKETGVSLTRSAQPLIGFNITGARNKKFKDDYRMIEAILQANPRAAYNSSGESSSRADISVRGNVPQSTSASQIISTSPILDVNGTPIMTLHAPSNGDRLMIIDLRPRANAEANRVIRGAGYEKNYKDCELQFLNIANIHVMRNSFAKIMELCINFGGMDQQWYQKVEQTSWLEYLRTILVASQFCVMTMKRDKCSVLCHCSDGWDRTAQVVSLSQILMDPYFRTMEGFAVLVEKEWLAFGHQFHKRCGHGSRNSFFMDERGPIFVQYVDCVYQLLRQHPTAFEFNEAFLAFVLDELYSCRFGTFLCDCERERADNKLSERTSSIWTYLLNPCIMLNEPPELQPQYQGKVYGRQDPHSTHSAKHAIQNQFFNPFYDPDQTNYTLYPDLRHSSIRLWTGYWLRFAKDPLGYDYHFPDPAQTLHHKAMDYLSDMNVMQKFKLRIESKNEATVQTFQKEFRNMYQEIDEYKSKCDEWRLRYETDTGSLMALCEKQKEELLKWQNGEHGVILNNKNEQEQSLAASTSKNITSSCNKAQDGSSQNRVDDSDDPVEMTRKECESWKQKCLELQVEVLQRKRALTLNGEDSGEGGTDKDLEVDRLKKYVLQLQSTIMQQRQQLQQQQQQNSQQSNSKQASVAIKRVDSWESVNDTWRTVSGDNEHGK